MGMIQQSINQGMSIAGFLFSQTDFAKTRKQVREIETKQKTAEKAQEIVEQKTTINEASEQDEAPEQIGAEVSENLANLATEKFKTDPTKENYEEALRSRRTAAAKKGWETRRANQEKEAAASQTIQAAIRDPFSIADTELQKAIETKREINKRKGGMM